MDHSTILYETPDARPLLRLDWNRCDGNYLACLALDSSLITLLDTRMPSLPAAELQATSTITALQWAPHSSGHLLAGSGRSV